MKSNACSCINMSCKKIFHFCTLPDCIVLKPGNLPICFWRRWWCVLLQLIEIVKLLMAKMRHSAIQRLFAPSSKEISLPTHIEFCFPFFYLCKIFVSDLIWIIDGKDSFLLPTIQSESFLCTSITMQLHRQKTPSIKVKMI